MAKQAAFYVVGLERPTEQRVAFEINHSDAKVIAGTPVSVNPVKLFRAKCGVSHVFQAKGCVTRVKVYIASGLSISVRAARDE